MKKYLLLFIGGFLLAVSTQASAAVRYVTETGTGDGSSWENASGSLQAMINASDAGDEIWVAKGVYKPTVPPNGEEDPRRKTFLLTKNVSIYGGFSGNETSRDARNWKENVTTLSGDLDGNDILDSGNAYRVFVAVDVEAGTTVDGLTITGAYNNDSVSLVINEKSFTRAYGGGISNHSSALTYSNIIVMNDSASWGGGIYNNNSPAFFKNITVKENKAAQYGAGILNERASHAHFENVSIYDNQTTVAGNTYGGGGVSNRSSNPTFINVSIYNNEGCTGGGMYNSSANPILTNVAIYNNTSTRTQGGAGMTNMGNSSPVLTNVTIAGNVASARVGGIFFSGGTTMKIRNSIIWGNTLSDGTPANISLTNTQASLEQGTPANTPEFSNTLIAGSTGSGSTWVTDMFDSGYIGEDKGNNIDSDPLFVDAENSDYKLTSTSPAIDKGDNTLYGAEQTPDLSSIQTDVVGNGRIYNNIIDMGAYEFSPASSLISVNANEILLFANPVEDFLFVRPGVTINKLSVYSTNGVLVDTQENVKNIVPVHQLQKGLYIIRIESSLGVFTHKIIKN